MYHGLDMARRRMLMLSPAVPWPGTTGGLVRIAALCRQMARHFDVTFVAPRQPGQQVPDDPRIRFRCPDVGERRMLRRAAALVSPSRPYHVAMYSRREIAAIVRREIADRAYDVVFGHFIYSLEYLDGSAVPAVIDQQNVDRVYWGNKAEHSAFPVSVFAGWNTRKTIAYENRRLSRIWAYVSVSDEDREQTRAYASPPVEHFWVGPNGVDTRRFTPAEAARNAAGAVVLGYLGSMDLQMNVEAVQRFCATTLPAVRRELQDMDVQFLVIGSNPSAAIRDLAAKTPGMSLSGTVPDVVPWLHKLDVLVCPLRIGAGTKLKVAEALSCGLPVVGSSMAFAGLPGRSGEHYVQEDDERRFAGEVARLARTPGAREAMGRKARELARDRLDWDAIGDRLAADIERALAGREGARS